jgi:peroxiredoxin
MVLATPLLVAQTGPPMMGEAARDFTLSTVDGKSVRLSEITAKGPAALIVLRGYPGYQCPFCNRQVQDLLRNSSEFEAAGVSVVMVYPGPAQDLGMRASEFLTGKKLPDHFYLLLDPDYRFTNLYGLRWDAPRETAYPSTFLIDGQGMIRWEKIAKEHGGRTTAAEILDVFKKWR